MSRVYVAMSGGVDSSVAAALLVEQGHEVTGVTMQLLPEGDEEGSCCGNDAVYSARRVCDLLGIPHYTLNSRDVFEREVVGPFAYEYAQGRTPNPCIVCNDRVKFADLLARISVLGGETLATGHYANIAVSSGRRWLERGLDPSKDQSYFLYRLTEPAIDHVVFPVGEMTKKEVRAYADSLNLPSAMRPESQEICFVPDGGIPEFVGARSPEAITPGSFEDDTGRTVGRHKGLAHYTVGQRKGLGLAGGPWFVSSLDAKRNVVTVGRDHSVRVTSILLQEVVWRADEDSVHAEVMVRYRAMPVPAVIERTGTGAIVTLDRPVPGVSPGQAVVCYSGSRVLGGGVVDCTR